MKIALALLVALCAAGCSEKKDELEPYINKVKDFQTYHETFSRYKVYLHTEGMTDKAKDLQKQIESYKNDLEAVNTPDDKHIRAIHNSMKRDLEEALRRLVEPDFPTFVPSAQKQVDFLESEVKSMNSQLEKLWKERGKTAPFPLKWPEMAGAE